VHHERRILRDDVGNGPVEALRRYAVIGGIRSGVVNIVPSVLKDIESLSGDIEKKIKALAGPCLEKIEIFDVYKGIQVAPGYKSIAYALVLRSDKKTLDENDIEVIMNNIINGLDRDGIKLRR